MHGSHASAANPVSIVNQVQFMEMLSMIMCSVLYLFKKRWLQSLQKEGFQTILILLYQRRVSENSLSLSRLEKGCRPIPTSSLVMTEALNRLPAYCGSYLEVFFIILACCGNYIRITWTCPVPWSFGMEQSRALDWSHQSLLNELSIACNSGSLACDGGKPGGQRRCLMRLPFETC